MKLSLLTVSRAQQVLRKYNTTALYLKGEWHISGELVDECVYARLTADNQGKFCLSTAALCWYTEDIAEMLSAVTKINDCLQELSYIDEELTR